MFALRAQPPVLSEVDPVGLVAAVWAAMRGAGGERAMVEAIIAREFAAEAVLATDSGTSALVMALRIVAGPGGTVAYPGYGCVDLAAAAVRAGVRVRLYDLDPSTLSPDLESVVGTIKRGVDAIVVAHLFGYPAEVGAVEQLALEAGIPVIEDAAQGAGGRLHGARLGALATISVLSFGRGKGLSGGAGGALLLRGHWAQQADALRARLVAGDRGFRPLAASAAQLLLGRPSIYGIPLAIPQLRLGEMVYHPAEEPGAISVGSARLVQGPLRSIERSVAGRSRQAAAMFDALAAVGATTGVQTVLGGSAGHLRVPARGHGGRELPAWLGVALPYPQALMDQPALAPVLRSGEPIALASRELAQGLVTLPTHWHITQSDIRRLVHWVAFRDEDRRESSDTRGA